MAELPKTITVQQDGKRATVAPADYARVKAKHMRAFGYPDVTDADVLGQVRLLLDGEEPSDIIGYFVERDLVRE